MMDDRLRSHSFPVAPSDYSDYACALAPLFCPAVLPIWPYWCPVS